MFMRGDEDVDEDDGEDGADEEANQTFKAPARPRASWAARSLYPTLTDLASQELFPPSQTSTPAVVGRNSSFTLGPVRYAGASKAADGDDDSSDSSSESDSSDSDSDAEGGGKKKGSRMVVLGGGGRRAR